MSNAPVFCSNCGARNEADAAFCESCGERLEEAAASAPAAQGAPAAVPAQPGPRKRSGLVIVGVVLLVLAGGTAALAATGKLAPLTNALGGLFGGGTTQPGDADSAIADSSQLVGGDDPLPPIRIPTDSPVVGEHERVTRPIPDSMIFELRPPGRTERKVTREELPPPTPPVPPPPPPPPPPAVVITTREPGTPTGGVTGPPSRHDPVSSTAARIAAGTTLALKSLDKVCTDKARIGQRFRATLQQEVAGENGAQLPRGTVVTFVVTELKRGANDQENTSFAIAAESLELGGTAYPVEATTDTMVLKRAGKGLLGALAGAAAGVVTAKAAGGDTKEAIAGGVVGGAAGAVVGSQIKGDACLDKNALIRITLTDPLEVP